MIKQGILENRVNRVYLSIGSNLGNKLKNLENVKYYLNISGISILKTSSYYNSKSWPNENFPNFLNIVLLVSTKLNLIKLFLKIKSIEKSMGRIVTKKNYPRICDIDIIDFNGKCYSEKYLNNLINIPHQRMHKRNFVLLPLYEINKTWFHPKLKKNIVNLIAKLSSNDLRSIKFI